MWAYSDTDAIYMAQSRIEDKAEAAQADVKYLAKKLHDFICVFCEFRGADGRCTEGNCQDNGLFRPREV